MTREEISHASVKDILMKYAYIGDRFWSSCWGDVELVEIDYNCNKIKLRLLDESFAGGLATVDENGRICASAECVLYHGKVGQSWTDYAIEKEKDRPKEDKYELVVGEYYKYLDAIYKCIRYDTENRYEDNEYMLQDVRSGYIIFLQEDEIESNATNIKPIDTFDASVLKPYDKVLTRYGNGKWFNTSYQFFDETNKMHYADSCGWTECIPLNFETANLLGTTIACPKFYSTQQKVKE